MLAEPEYVPINATFQMRDKRYFEMSRIRPSVQNVVYSLGIYLQKINYTSNKRFRGRFIT